MDTEIKLIQQALKYYEQASLICGVALFTPIAVAYIASACRESLHQSGIHIHSRLLSAYLDLRFGPSRIISPSEIDEIARSDSAKHT